jgi:hypothetical protein
LKKAVTGYGVNGVALPQQSIYSLDAKLIWHIQKEPKMGKLCAKFYHCQPLHSMLALPKVPLFDLDQSTAAKGVLPSRAIVKT